jgi:hypothetical protein
MYPMYLTSFDGLNNTMTAYWLGFNPLQGQEFFFLPVHPYWLWDLHNLLSNGTV